jgi:glycosyltransferase involved in cell wall biosynthesis
LAVAGPQSGDVDGEKLMALTEAFPQQFQYLGVLAPAKLGPVVGQAKAVVLPSRLDNLPNTCLEAMSRGRVVVGPNDVSFDELIEDGTSGLLFEAGDVEALRAAILRAWELPPEISDRYGRAARDRIRQLDPEYTLPELERFFETITDTACADAREASPTRAEKAHQK